MIPARAYMFVALAFILNIVLAAVALGALLTLNFGVLLIVGLSLILVPVIAGFIVGYRGMALVLLFFSVLIIGILANSLIPSTDAGIVIIRGAAVYFLAALATSMVRK